MVQIGFASLHRKKVSVLLKTHKRRFSATDNKHFHVSY